MKSATGTFGIVKVTAYDTAADEAAGIAAQIKDLNIFDNSQTCEEHTPPNEIAVLCRTNKIANALREALKAHGIPVRERKQADNPLDWKTARAFIALLTNPESDRLAGKFIELKLGAEKAAQMQREATADFTTVNEKFLHIRSVAVGDVTTAMVAAGIGRESIGRVRALVDQLDRNATLLELQGALAELAEAEQEETDGVVCQTLHKSKGTEHDVIFLPAWEENVFPSAREQDGEALQEARRLAYVGITRARRLVAISHSAKRNKEWSGVQDQKPSRFINEIQP